MRERLEEFIEDTGIINELHDPENRLIMLIGGTDTGKTVLAGCIADLLSKQTTLGLVDSDMGQSHIGPPTTVSWGKITEGFKSWSDIAVEDFYFTGTLSPAGNLLPTVTGTKLMTDMALASCNKVIIDTSGMIAGPAGRALKLFKIDLLSPDLVITLEYSGEAGDIVDPFRSQRVPKIYRLPVPSVVKTKSPSMRSHYRAERFRAYFSGAPMVEIPLKDLGLRFIRDQRGLSREALINRVVSLRNERNRDIGLGIIKKVCSGEKALLIRSPVRGRFLLL
jgi:polynucleotide 5'-hydroxyl-kinase GRC3/NOL9